MAWLGVEPAAGDSSEERRAGVPRDTKEPESFLVDMPQFSNVYEIVVVAAQRARQVNLANRILPPDGQVNPVEKGLMETLAGQVKYEVQEKARTA
jgi:DNA-directed RNA polymerase subunit K/omega